MDVKQSANDQQNTRARIQMKAQVRKMNEEATKHPPSTMPGNREANAGGVNREEGDRKTRTNDRATDGGE
ncbi:hypothetical protein [Tabrizicola soli]|uniref:Uncharacterized protein n=1 Tax=Tabrizicola soli TaxID=2185115 RepID=A0ABV7DV02_9RHOB|nr:hypothetical protein [Tabrizicola soli]